MLWVALGLAGFVLLAVVAWCVRRRTIGDVQSTGADLLDLTTLEKMRQAGTITEQEFKVLRAQAIRALGVSNSQGSQR